MRKEEVPQDSCLLDGQREICYAVDASGHYVLAPTAGWEPSNIANIQAWEVIRAELEATSAAVRAGRQSPLAYHMVRTQMDVPLLADYVSLWRWQVRRHLRPEIFARLKPALLQRYADLFQISVAALQRLPEVLDLPQLGVEAPLPTDKDS